MEKFYVEVKVRLVVDLNKGVKLSDVIQEMDYGFESKTDGAVIVDTEIRDYEATKAVE